MPHKFRFIIIAISLFFSISTYAKKAFMAFEKIVQDADLIVTGNIVSVKENSYILRINKVLKGNTDSTIEVQKFNEWTCDIRYAKHKVGEKLCVLLERKSSKWEIINGSCGELPVKNDSLSVHQYQFEKSAGTNKQFSISLNDFSNAIIALQESNQPGKSESGKSGFEQWLFNKVKNSMAKNTGIVH